MIILCKTAEIPEAHSTSETLKHEDIHSGNNNVVQESNHFRFYQRNNSSTLQQLTPHTNTKWSPWTPIPNVNNLKHNFSTQRDNTTNSSIVNGTDIFTTGNNDVSNSTILQLIVTNTTFNQTYLNRTNQIDSANNSQNFLVTPSSATVTTMSNTYRNTKNRISYAKGITYYFWDSVYLILKCFKDHWMNGVVDCVTSRASTLLDGLLGIGSTRRHQLLEKEGFELVPYNESLEESPRNDEGLAIEDDDEDEEEVYDEGNIDSREGESV
jgi:hypothetical protein